MADPTSSTAAEPGTETSPGPAVAPDGGPEPTAPVPGDGGADLARRRFFREFAGEIASTAATVMGAAQALQRTSGELAGVLLDPTRLEQPRGARRGPARRRRAGRDRPGLPDRVPDGRRDDPVRRPADAAAVAHGVRRVVRGRGDLRDPERDAARRAGRGPGGRARDGPDRGARPRHEALRPAGDVPRGRERDAERGAGERLVEAAMTRVMAAYASVGELSEDGDAIAAAMQAEADAIVAEAVADHGALVDAGVALLAGLPRADAGPLRVLVHGPGGTLAGGQFGTALSIAITAHQREIPIRVVVPEGRPRFTGSRVGCWELAAAGVPHLLVADAAAPALIAAGEIDAVLIPAERVAANGDVAAAIGTLAIASVAARSRVPVIACVAASTLDSATSDGSAISIGYLDAEELDRIEKVILAPPGTETASRPTTSPRRELVTTWLTATGPRTPPFAPPALPEPAAPAPPDGAPA